MGKLSGGLVGAIDKDQKHRRQKAERDAQMQMAFCHNRLIEALRGLEVEQALLLVERVRRGLAEHLAAERAGQITAGRSY